jgi:hypothetical protein
MEVFPMTGFELGLAENPMTAIGIWFADAVAALTGNLTVTDYLNLRKELITGMLRAGASEMQISAALSELNRHVLSMTGLHGDVEASVETLGNTLSWGFGAAGSAVGAVVNPLTPALWPIALGLIAVAVIFVWPSR